MAFVAFALLRFMRTRFSCTTLYTAFGRTWTSQNDVELSSDAVSEADAALSSEGSFVDSAMLTCSRGTAILGDFPFTPVPRAVHTRHPSTPANCSFQYWQIGSAGSNGRPDHAG